MDDGDTTVVVTGQTASIEPWLSVSIFVIAVIAIVFLTRWKGPRVGRVGLILGAIVLPLAKMAPILMMDINIVRNYGAHFINFLPMLLSMTGVIVVGWLVFALPAFWYGKKLHLRRTADAKAVSAF